MKKLLLIVPVCLLYAAVVVPLAAQMRERPVEVKLGYVPAARVVKLVAGDQKTLLAELNILRVLFYYGALVEKWRDNVVIRPEYYNMFKTLESAIILDPYNMDAYYFAQAAFTWEIGRARDVNRLLDYGMRHRTWDWSLPFYAGFNAAYFLKDYPAAASYMERAAEITGDSLFTKLAARYHYEAGAGELGVAFLDTMIAQATEPRLKHVYQLRKEALLAVEAIEEAIEKFRANLGRDPQQLEELTARGILDDLPADPYGGTFYLDEQGKVRSTSSFAAGRVGDEASDDATTEKSHETFPEVPSP